MRVRRRAVVLALLLAVAVDACSGGGSSALAQYDAGGASAEAVGGGVLSHEGGCLYLHGPSGRQLPVFPYGAARWDGAVLTFGGREHREGEEIAFGGGAARPRPGTMIPPGCDRSVPTFLVGRPLP